MGFSQDSNGKLKQNRMFLAKPTKERICVISGAENVKFTQYFNNICELTFTVYQEKNGEINNLYEQILKFKLIELQEFGWYQILSVAEKWDDKSKQTYKEIKACQLENSLIYRKIYDITGTFSLYDTSDPYNSLLHIITDKCGWNVGHIDAELLSLYRTFDIDSTQIYSFLTQTASESFGCVFIFNSYDKTISAYKLENIGSLSNVLISKKNILREYVRNDTDSMITTKMAVKGGDDGTGGNLDIRSVNFGLDYLVNFDYFLNTDWMTQETINAYNNFKSEQDAISFSYTTALSSLKTKQAELATLQNELIDLEANRTAQEGVMGASVQLHGRVPVSGDSDYTIYQNARTAFNSYVTQIASKTAQITSKKAEISSVQATLDSIDLSIDINNYLTSAQLAELNQFVCEDSDYSDETFIITDIMTEAEVIDMKLELKQLATEELARISQPQYEISITADNLFTIDEGKDKFISYEEWRDSFVVGNIITIKFNDNYSIQARLMSMSIDFDNPENIELTFSNRNSLDDKLIQLSEIIAEAGKAASSYSLKYFGYNKASAQTSAVSEFLSGSLNATLNAYKNNDNQEVLFDQYGLHGRKWLAAQNKYDDHQLWLTNYGILLTSDSFQTASLAIGMITAPDGNPYYGIDTDTLVGNILLGTKLKITNNSGNYSIDNNGFTANATVGSNTYQVGINPSTIAEIINVKINGVNQFYIDIVTNKLIFNGTLSATALNADMINALNIVATSVKSSWVYTGSISANQISSGTMSANYIYGGTINGNNVNITNLNASNITAGTITGDRINGGTISGTSINGPEATFSSITVRGTSSYTYIYPTHIETGNLDVNYITCSTLNSGTPLTSKSTIYTNSITASNTGYGNIDFLGFDNACGVNWAQSTFETKTTSDIRLKYNMCSLEFLPDELFYSLKPKSFKYKPETTYRKGIFFGLIAQEVETAFVSFGLNPYEYDLVELKDVKKYTDDGFYVKDETHRLNDKNLIAWIIQIVQNQNKRIKYLESNINL